MGKLTSENAICTFKIAFYVVRNSKLLDEVNKSCCLDLNGYRIVNAFFGRRLCECR